MTEGGEPVTMSNVHRAAFISSCHLNTSFMAKPPVDGILVPALPQWAEDNDIQLISMRCPETEFAGAVRAPRGRKFYNNAEGFRDLCGDIADVEATRIKAHGNVIAVIGVTTSPSCGTGTGVSPYAPSGIYMEELKAECAKRGLYPEFVSIWALHLPRASEILAELIERTRHHD